MATPGRDRKAHRADSPWLLVSVHGRGAHRLGARWAPRRAGTAGASQPAWTPPGPRWRSCVRPDLGNEPDGSGAATPLSHDKARYGRPAYSPDGSALAFVDQDNGGLCVAPASGAGDATSCLMDDEWRFTDVAWGPTGRALALIGEPRASGDPGGVVEYLAARGDPALVDAWARLPSQGGLVHADATAAQLSWAPNAGALAVLDGAGGVGLLATSGDAIDPVVKPLAPVSACAVAWSPGGRLTIAQDCSRSGRLSLVDPASSVIQPLGAGDEPAWRPLVTGS